MRTVYTAILSNYDDLKEPTVISPGWQYICFTDQPLVSDVWQIKHIEPGNDPQRTAREIKIMFHNHIDTDESMWIDGTFKININLDMIWRHFKEPFTAPRHPIRHCVYDEIHSCIANGRGNSSELLAQEQEYKRLGVPRFADNIITSGLLLRNKKAIPLCEAWWAEMQGRSVRDQVAFARVCAGFEWHNIRWDYTQQNDLKHIPHFKFRH